MTVLTMEKTGSTFHTPVLVEDVLRCFDFPRSAIVVDGTLGLGGHAEALLRRYPALTVVGCEWDAQAAALARDRLSAWDSRFCGVVGSYADLPALLPENGFSQVDGILLDLGFSSWQLDHADRGFSFQRRGPLDMRMSLSLEETAWDILERSSAEELSNIFKTYGEERFAWRIAGALRKSIDLGKLSNDALAVAECIRQAVPSRFERIDPATRCFQALRIAVNHELQNVERFLSQMESLLAPGGRAAVIAYHSLEDRLVKQAFRQAAKGCVCPPQIPQCMCAKAPWARLWVKKSIIPTDDEIAANPRSRSARLRVLEKFA